jgi:hypothetical protein
MHTKYGQLFKLTLLLCISITGQTTYGLKRFIVTIVNNNNQMAHLTNGISTTTPEAGNNLNIPLQQRPISITFNDQHTNPPLNTSSTPFDTHLSAPITIANNNNQSAHLHNTVATVTQPPLKSDPTPIIMKSTLHQLCSSCWQHKGALICFTIAALYTTLISTLVYKSYTIPQRCTWARWGTWTYDELLQTPQAYIAEQLYTAIEQYYQTEPVSYGFLTPVIRFLRDVDNELSYIDGFEKIHHWLEKYYLSFLFPQQKATRLKLAEMKMRLLLFKDSLLAWMYNDYEKTITCSAS